MAKIKNKIANSRAKKNINAKCKMVYDWKQEMLELVDKQQYEAAIDVMAKIAEAKLMDAEVMERGAFCYFKTNDLDRAATWINHALTYDPNNVKAKLLLGRLCVVQSRTEDGLRILNKLATDYEGRMTAEIERELGDILEEIQVRKGIAVDAVAFPALKSYAAASKAEETSAEKDAKGALDRLKALLKKNKERKVLSKQDSPAPEKVKKSAEQPVIANKCEEQNYAGNEAIISQIMEKQVGYAQKVSMLNAFAGSCYMKKDYNGAIELLKKALEIDPGNGDTLRNLCYAYISAEDAEAAMKVAASMPMVDFAVLRAIED